MVKYKICIATFFISIILTGCTSPAEKETKEFVQTVAEDPSISYSENGIKNYLNEQGYLDEEVEYALNKVEINYLNEAEDILNMIANEPTIAMSQLGVTQLLMESGYNSASITEATSNVAINYDMEAGEAAKMLNQEYGGGTGYTSNQETKHLRNLGFTEGEIFSVKLSSNSLDENEEALQTLLLTSIDNVDDAIKFLIECGYGDDTINYVLKDRYNVEYTGESGNLDDFMLSLAIASTGSDNDILEYYNSVSTSKVSIPTALCNDNTLSYSANHSGTCSHHGGVRTWYV